MRLRSPTRGSLALAVLLVAATAPAASMAARVVAAVAGNTATAPATVAAASASTTAPAERCESLLKHGHNPEARACYEQALALAPAFAPARHALEQLNAAPTPGGSGCPYLGA